MGSVAGICAHAGAGMLAQDPDLRHVRGMRLALLLAAASGLLFGCSDGSPSLEGSATAAPPPGGEPSRASSVRSPMPSAEEWRNAPIAEVGEASSMGCTGRRVREWLRVSCAGRSDSGGRPTTVQATSGDGVFALASEGNTSFVVPVVEGTLAEADFAWTDGTRTLVVAWKKGEARPALVARFVGTAPKLEATTGVGEHRACACYREITGAADCNGMTIVNPSLDECAATYQDCLEVLECAAGKSQKPPRCGAGQRNLPPFGMCTPMCGPSLPPCPVGTTCNVSIGGLCQ